MNTLELRAMGEVLTETGLSGRSGSYVFLEYRMNEKGNIPQLELSLNNLYGRWALDLGTAIVKEDKTASIKDALYRLENRLKALSMSDLYNSIQLPDEMRNDPIVAKEHLEACKNSIRDLIYRIDCEMADLVKNINERTQEYEYSLTKDPSYPEVDMFAFKEAENSIEAVGVTRIGNITEIFTADMQPEEEEVKIECSKSIKEVLEKNTEKLDQIKNKILDIYEDYEQNREPGETYEEYNYRMLSEERAMNQGYSR